MRINFMVLIIVTHFINIAVLVMVISGLARGDAGMELAYGPDSPARRILASVYGAILLGSAAALAAAALSGTGQRFLIFSASLFAVQLTYKLATIFTVGLGNPVVVANAIICIPLALSVGWIILNA